MCVHECIDSAASRFLGGGSAAAWKASPNLVADADLCFEILERRGIGIVSSAGHLTEPTCPFVPCLPSELSLPPIPSAQVGLAAYNNASSPSLDAFVYNTNGEPGDRFSYLATTPWCRMYHSVAALTLQGHVLTTGCNDPPYCSVSGLVLETLASPFRTYALSLQSVVVRTLQQPATCPCA